MTKINNSLWHKTIPVQTFRSAEKKKKKIVFHCMVTFFVVCPDLMNEEFVFLVIMSGASQEILFKVTGCHFTWVYIRLLGNVNINILTF